MASTPTTAVMTQPANWRLVPVSAPALLISALLFLLMYQLIATETPSLDEPPSPIDPVVMDPPEPPQILDAQEVVKPIEPQAQPDWQTAKVDFDDPGGPLTMAPPQQGFDPGQDPIANTGGGIVAYLRVQPDYPIRAARRGIEGYVDLAFDITAAGATTNIRVLTAQPQGVFENAATRALKKWKYKVPIEDGIPRGQVDMMTRITFTLQD